MTIINRLTSTLFLALMLCSINAFSLEPSISLSSSSPPRVVPETTIALAVAAENGDGEGYFVSINFYINNKWQSWAADPTPWYKTLDDEGVFDFQIKAKHSNGIWYESNIISIESEALQITGTTDPVGTHVGPLFVDMLDIFGNEVPSWKDVGVEGGIPEVAVQVNVADFGAVADDDIDDAPAFQAAVDALQGAGAVSIPSGTFDLHSVIKMKSGAVLRGQGMGQTRLLVDHADVGFDATGTSTGGGYVTAETGFTPVIEGANKGSLRIRVSDSHGYNAGDFLQIVQSYDPSLHETMPGWRQESWVNRLIGQFTKIVLIDGNWITLSDPLHIDMNHELGVWVTTTEMKENIGYEDFKAVRADIKERSMFRFNYTSNSWMRGIHSEFARKAHVAVANSRHFEVRDSYFVRASFYGGGGHGYGVELLFLTADSLITNNVFKTLRHAMIVHLGANGNAFTHNYSIDPYQNTGGTWMPSDMVLHGHYPYANLFEANIVQRPVVSDHWGPSGPDNTFLRNSVRSFALSAADYSNDQYAIGNNITKNSINFDFIWGVPGYFQGDPDMFIDSVDESTWVIHLNNTDDYLNQVPQAGYENSSVPNSYIYESAPEFLLGYNFPALGSDVATERLPAEDRYLTELAFIPSEIDPLTLVAQPDPEPTDPEPTDPEPTDPEPTDPEPTDPEPTDPEPTDPEPTDPEPTDPEPTDPEPTDPEPTDPEPTDPEPTDPEPTTPEPTDLPDTDVPDIGTTVDDDDAVDPNIKIINDQVVVNIVGYENSTDMPANTLMTISATILDGSTYKGATLYINGAWVAWNGSFPLSYDYSFIYEGFYTIQLKLQDTDGNITYTNPIQKFADDPTVANPRMSVLSDAGVLCQVQVVDEWLTSYNAELLIVNDTDQTLSNWQADLSFQYGAANVVSGQADISGTDPVYFTSPSAMADIPATSNYRIKFNVVKAISGSPAHIRIGDGICASSAVDPEPTDPEPTDPEPTDPEPTDPEPTDPEPTDPEPTDPEPTDPETTDPETTDPETTDPEPTDPEPTDPEPTDPEPTDPEPTDTGPLFGDSIVGVAGYRIGTAVPADQAVTVTTMLTNEDGYTGSSLYIGGAWAGYSGAVPFNFNHTFSFEGNYALTMKLKNTSGATTETEAYIVFVDDPAIEDPIMSVTGSSGVHCELNVLGEWATSYNAELVLTNTTSSDIQGWSTNLEFEHGFNQLSTGQALVSGVDPVKLDNKSWTAKIPANGTRVVKLNVSKAISKSPAHMRISGGICQ